MSELGDGHYSSDDVHQLALTVEPFGVAGIADTGLCDSVDCISNDVCRPCENIESTGVDLVMSCDAIVSSSDRTPHDDKVAELREVLKRISPMPKCKAVRQRKRTAEHAEVLTSSPFKNRLLEKKSVKKVYTKPLAKSKVNAEQSSNSKEAADHVRETARIKPDAKKATGRTVAKCSRPMRKLKCRLDKGRKPSELPPAISAKTKAMGLPCSVCGILENSVEDIEFAQDWIQCITCKGWCHESCGEMGGIFDDDYFTCAQCIE